MGEGTYIKKEDCPDCGGESCLSIYTDGKYCHKCEKASGAKGEPKVFRPIHDRKISKATCMHYGYEVLDNGDHRWPTLGDTGQKPRGTKVRKKALDSKGKKVFVLKGGTPTAFFGQNRADTRSKFLVVTEGELDAMSVNQAFGNKWAAVSLPNGVDSVKAVFAKQAAWIEQFPKVVLWFDADEPGQKAVRDAIACMTPGKAHVVQEHPTIKDANEMLMTLGEKDIVNRVWGAEKYIPESVVQGEALLDHLFRPVEQGIPYPIDGLNAKLRGIRKKEIVMFTGGSGTGKSTVVRQIARELPKLIPEGSKVGYIGLEETVQTSLLKMIGPMAGVAELHLDPSLLPEEEIRKYAREIMDQLVFLDMSFTSSSAADLKYNIRYLVQGCGCDYIILDHISFVISGETTDNERKTIDTLMHSLRTLCQQIDAGFILVSHLKRPDKGKSWAEGRIPQLTDLRGSASLEQLSDVIVGIHRDTTEEEDRNVLHLTVVKNRPVGYLGYAGSMTYDTATDRLVPNAETLPEDLGPVDVDAFER